MQAMQIVDLAVAPFDDGEAVFPDDQQIGSALLDDANRFHAFLPESPALLASLEEPCLAHHASRAGQASSYAPRFGDPKKNPSRHMAAAARSHLRRVLDQEAVARPEKLFRFRSTKGCRMPLPVAGYWLRCSFARDAAPEAPTRGWWRGRH